MSTASHHDSRSHNQPIAIVSTDQGPKVGPYIFGKTLGTGSTGKVKLAKNTETGDIVAIKIVRKDFLDNKPSLKKKMRREISVLKVLSHPNLMSLIDVFEIETHLFLVMEFVDGLELFEYLVRRGALPIPQALSFFQQMISGLDYCHRRLICHRDLKPENLLLDRSLNIKIADFGMTSLNPPGSLLETSCGSPHYCDPMVVSGEMYDGLKADIWSCGVILYAMVTGRLPFDDENIPRLLQKVKAGQYHLPSDLPKDLRDIIKQMLTLDPDQRISLEGIKAHPWFNSIPPRDTFEDNFVTPTEPVLRIDPLILRSLVDLGWGDAATITNELAKVGPSMEKVFYQQLEKHPMFRRPGLGKHTRMDAVGMSGVGGRLPAPVVHTGMPQQQHLRPQAVHAVRKQVGVDGNGVPVVQAGIVQQHVVTPGVQVAAQQSAVADAVNVPAVGEGRGAGEAGEIRGEVNENGNGKEDEAEAEVEAQLKAMSVRDGANGDGAGSTRTAADSDASGSSGNLVRQSSLRCGLTVEEVSKQNDREEEAIQNVAEGQQRSWFDSMRSMWKGQTDTEGEEKKDGEQGQGRRSSE